MNRPVSIKSKYYELLKDPRWQRMRLRIMDRDDFECRKCGDRTTTLNVHHRYYVSGRHPWEYPPFSLVTLCERCHAMERDIGGESCPNTYREWESMLGMLLNDAPEDDVWKFVVELTDAALSAAETLPDLFRAILWMVNNPNYIEAARAAIREQKGTTDKPDTEPEPDNQPMNANSNP